MLALIGGKHPPNRLLIHFIEQTLFEERHRNFDWKVRFHQMIVFFPQPATAALRNRASSMVLYMISPVCTVHRMIAKTL